MILVEIYPHYYVINYYYFISVYTMPTQELTVPGSKLMDRYIKNCYVKVFKYVKNL